MASSEMVILTNMCLVSCGDMVLVQRRNDPKWPGLVFPGGHVEPGESFTAAVIREVWEETGLTIASPRLCGLKQFWTRDGQVRYIVFLYRTDRFTGELRSSEEGEVFWMHRDALEKEPLAKGFADMLPLFYGDSMGELYYGNSELRMQNCEESAKRLSCLTEGRFLLSIFLYTQSNTTQSLYNSAFCILHFAFP